MTDAKDSKTSMSDRVLNTIEEKHIVQKPKWHFLVHEWVVWGVAIAALVLGSIATTLTIYIANSTRFIERQIHFSDIRVLFNMIPLLWLMLLMVGIFYTMHALRSTRRGYRWHASWLVGAALVVSMFVGWSAYASGIGAAIDRYLLTEVPLYKPLTGFQPAHWMNTPQGIVAGVVEYIDEEKFILQALDGKRVEVVTTATTTLKGYNELREGLPVRVVGTTTEENVFEASAIAPFRGRGAVQGRGLYRGEMESRRDTGTHEGLMEHDRQQGVGKGGGRE